MVQICIILLANLIHTYITIMCTNAQSKTNRIDSRLGCYDWGLTSMYLTKREAFIDNAMTP